MNLNTTSITAITATKARSSLYRLIDEASSSHQPITITGKRQNAVLVGESDWLAIQETLHLLSVPNMRESIHAGLAEPVTDCATGLDW